MLAVDYKKKFVLLAFKKSVFTGVIYTAKGDQPIYVIRMTGFSLTIASSFDERKLFSIG